MRLYLPLYPVMTLTRVIVQPVARQAKNYIQSGLDWKMSRSLLSNAESRVLKERDRKVRGWKILTIHIISHYAVEENVCLDQS